MICVLSWSNCGEENLCIFGGFGDIIFGVGEFFVCMFFIFVFGGIFFMFIDIEGGGSWRLWLIFGISVFGGFVFINDNNCVYRGFDFMFFFCIVCKVWKREFFNILFKVKKVIVYL